MPPLLLGGLWFSCLAAGAPLSPATGDAASPGEGVAGERGGIGRAEPAERALDGAPDEGGGPLGLAIPNLQRPEQPSTPKARYTLLPVPLVGYDSDNGVSLGVAGALFYNDGVAQPYRDSLIAQALVTTVGVSQDYLKADLLDLFGTGFRLNGELRYLLEPNASYYGVGNTTKQQPAGASYYQFGRSQPGLRLELRHALGGDFFWYGGYLLEYASIDIYSHSLLADQRPTGLQGGFSNPVQTGFVYDTRDFEPWPRHGQYDDLSVRTAGPLTLSNYDWSGATAVFRIYEELFWKVVVAERLFLDVMVGDVPFFDEDATGGLEEMHGLGGYSTMRGFVKDRFLGDGKLLENLELRRLFYGFEPWGQRIDLGATVFTDVGRVYGDSFVDGPAFLLHWDVGGGLRAMLNRDLVVRFDVGVSEEGPRVFLLFNNMF